MQKLKFIAVFLFSIIIITACSGTGGGFSTQTETMPNEQATPMAEQDIVEESKTDADDGTSSGETGSKKVSESSRSQVSLDKADKSQDKPVTVTERKIIRNADLRLEADSPEDVQQKITTIAESKKGFVIQSTQRSSNIKARGRDTVQMTIRVPAEKFNEALDEIRKTAGRVIMESVTGRDVTEEFIDIEARLKTKKALEQKFIEIMNRSKTVQEALNVQRELANVRGEIERIEGRKRFLENQASLSTIKITIQTPAAISGSSTGFFYELREAVSNGFDAALSFVLILVQVVIALIPFLLLVVLPIFLLLRYFWRKYKNKRIAKKIVEEELDVE